LGPKKENGEALSEKIGSVIIFKSKLLIIKEECPIHDV